MDQLTDNPAMGNGQSQLIHFPTKAKTVAFNRAELSAILGLYGRYVASGEWRDYALDFNSETACFLIFRRAAEQPLYRIIKNPSLARKQGAFSVVTQGGVILKRGQELAQVLSVLLKKPKLTGL